MNRFRLFSTLTLLSLSTLAFACSGKQSPTEPSFDTPVAAKSLAASQDKRHGADDPAGDDHGQQGQGADDPAGDNHGQQGHGADDPAGDDHGGRQGRPQRPARGGQAEGTVSSVDAGSLVLAGGQRIAVNGQTQWNRRGDLFTLQQVAAAVAAGKPTRAEARGTRQTDGSLLAQTIKAEVDGR
ncbi:MAG TPA: DUF5666 domain-containing protein [Thermoanaerobaculia bacterium]